MDSKIELKNKNPDDVNANILSKIFLTWTFPLFKRGYKHGLSVEEIWQAREGDRSGPLGDRLEAAWQYEQANAQEKGCKPSLSKAIMRSFWLEYMLCGAFAAALFVILWPMQPYILGLFIRYFAGEKSPEAYRNAHIYNFCLNAIIILTALMYNHVVLIHGIVGMKVRIACCSLMFRKILKLSRSGSNLTAPGQVINLMSNDVNRFDLAAGYLNFLWVMPFCVPVVSYLIWEHIGLATLAALAVIIVQGVFFQGYLSWQQGVFRGKIAKRTDERVNVMSELVNGVQVIKMYAWETPFEKLVDKLRKLEVHFILQTSIIKGFSTAISVFTERFILFAAIYTFLLLGGHLRAETTFSLLQYFNLLQFACNILLPNALTYLEEARVSVRRIEDFLTLEELPNAIEPLNISKDEEKKAAAETKHTKLIIDNVSASWLPDPTGCTTLRNISISATPGEFIGVVGLVGCGKSSLLQLILGELKPSRGSLFLGGARLAYASQDPWLFVGTVRQNILFGLSYDRTRYNKVVKACALVRDFELLPAGDLTLVGDRGISLSGGQRARIGLARACYRKADVYLLDDPLSAVDTHVGKHLVSECIMGLLRHSTRILVTHQLHHLKEADNIIILREGGIETQGKFDDISQSPLFEELIKDSEPEENVENPKGGIETQGKFDDISQSPLFEELIKDSEPEENVENPKVFARQRTMSIQSRTSTITTNEGGNVDIEDEPDETEELMEQGRVSGSVYKKYFRAGGGWCLLIFTVIAVLLAQIVTSISDLWLTHWMNILETNDKNTNSISDSLNNFKYFNGSIEIYNATLTPNTTTTLNNTVTTLNDAVTTLNDAVTTLNDAVTEIWLEADIPVSATESDYSYYIYVWAIGIAACMVLTTGRSILFLWVCMRSSIKIHNQMFSNILAATMHFFDTNPSGRILNRFSKDMGVIDEVLPRTYLESMQIFMVMLGILFMVAIVNPVMLITTAVCGVFMYFWTLIYLNTAQVIKRVEGVTRSPVFSHVSATMAGITTVRACGTQHLLRTQFDDKQDVHTAAWYLTLVTNTVFSIWLSLISATYVIVIAYTFLLMDDGTTQSGNVGLALSQGLILVGMVQHGIRQATDVISQMTSVERVQQFTSLPKEKTDGPPAPIGWPKQARIIFKDLYLRYTPETEPVLKNLNIIIESGWKVGVVGRTGAGKSSLISALFRLAPIDGHVFIDDIDTGSIALKELRSKISIIPQEPVLFSASLRYNMDPFDKYTDEDIWRVLEQVELKSRVSSLSSEVSAGGSNFSAGQRQLLCLARAALARNKLLVLDEATANVDPNTDALIQRSIRKHFTDCSVITVAHRLHTVADSDRVVVMEAGQIIECDHPHELLQKEDGAFTQMVKQLGPASEQSLRELASEAFSRHHSGSGPETDRYA